MSKKNKILAFGTIIVVLFIILWIQSEKSSFEPWVALVGAIVTLIGYFLPEENVEVKTTKSNSDKSGNKIDLTNANINSNGNTTIIGGDNIQTNQK